MHYERDQYASGFSICGLIIAGAFLYWGFNTLFNGFIIGWGHSILNLWWLGFIWILIGVAIISRQIQAIVNRSNLRTIVLREFEQNPGLSIEEISVRTGISIKDVRAITLDLKARGMLKGKFSTTTGQLKDASVSNEGVKTLDYCSNCGTQIDDESATYCSYCGTRLK
jgi:hypothetical protein